MDDDTLQMTMLFDFFGDLLTDKQREYFDLYHNEDLSLAEIAEKTSITRQGVFDIIKRAEKTLTELEHKTGVVRRWREMQFELDKAEETARQILRLTQQTYEAGNDGSDETEPGYQVRQLAKTLLHILAICKDQ